MKCCNGFFKILLIAVSIFSFAGCGSKENKKSTSNQYQHPDAKPLADISLSLSSPLIHGLDASGYDLKIQKAALGKEFILETLILSAQSQMRFVHAKTKIISFIKHNNSIFLIEPTPTRIPDGEIFYTLPEYLAEFPILSENETSISINFNDGMKTKVIYDPNFTIPLPAPDTSTHFRRANLAFIKETKFLDQSKFMISQIVQFELSHTTNNNYSSSTAEIRYTFSPHILNENFIPMAIENASVEGFFTTDTQMNPNGSYYKNISKFDFSKPIIFMISRNTPASMIDAIKDGILYWNRAAGRNIITIQDAPENAEPYDPRYNMVYWNDTPNAMAAFSSHSRHPRTGEILSTQIYMPSKFVHVINNALFTAEAQPSNPQQSSSIRILGFSNDTMNIELDNSTGSLNENIFSQFNGNLLNHSKHSVTETVAHEVGHSLGLRHNFAGSLSANINSAQFLNTFDNFLRTGTMSNNIILTSSVMDYYGAKAQVLMGYEISSGRPAYEYDSKIIQAQINNTRLRSSSLPFYCTDEHVSVYTDCKLFDFGHDVLNDKLESTKDFIKNYHHNIYKDAVRFTKVGENNTPFSVESLSLGQQALTYQVGTYYEYVISLLNPDNSFLKTIWGQRTQQLSTQQKREKNLNYITTLVNNNGGFQNILKSYTENDFNEVKNSFHNLWNDSRFHSGTYYGTAYHFNAGDISILNSIFDALIRNTIETMPEVELTKIKFNSTYMSALSTENPLMESLASVYADKIIQYAFSMDGTILPHTVGTARLSLPRFSYSNAVRQLALGLFSSLVTSNYSPVVALDQANAFTFASRNRITAAWNAIFSSSIGTANINDLTSSTNMQTYPTDVARRLHILKRTNEAVISNFSR